MNFLIKKPSAWVPIALSVLMLVIMFFFFIFSSLPAPQADEGAGAHLFQIWLALEACMILFFGLNRLPESPKQTIIILTIQIISVLIVCFPVFYFQL